MKVLLSLNTTETGRTYSTVRSAITHGFFLTRIVYNAVDEFVNAVCIREFPRMRVGYDAISAKIVKI
jgi:hypothetical protein